MHVVSGCPAVSWESPSQERDLVSVQIRYFEKTATGFLGNNAEVKGKSNREDYFGSVLSPRAPCIYNRFYQ